MKYFAPLFIAAAMMTSCGNNGNKPAGDSAHGDSLNVSYYGDTITADGAITAAELKSKLGSQPMMNCKVEGTIESVCQKKGCWTEVVLNDSETVHVTFKDYGFFVPKDAAGKKIIMEGVAKYDTTDVAMLKHLASDAGEPQSEIDKITEPEYDMVFEASGVMIKE